MLSMRFICAIVALATWSGLSGEIVRPEEEHPPLFPSLFQDLEEFEEVVPSAVKQEEQTLTILTEESEPSVVAEPSFAPLLNLEELEQTVTADQEKESSRPEREETAALEDLTSAARSLTIQWSTVFSGAPFVYSLLLLLSMSALFICLYSELRIRQMGVITPSLLSDVRQKLETKDFDALSARCAQEGSLVCKILSAALAMRKSELSTRAEAMRLEGKRQTVLFWQRLSWLSDIALVAPLLGLFGTVLGMFYAFYDLNSSQQTITSLFDGLGISVGTTLAGLSVAILALALHTFARYRLVRTLAQVENEVLTFLPLIEE